MPVVVTGTVKVIDRWDYGDDLVLAAGDRGDVHCLFTRHPADKSTLAEAQESVVITGYVDQRPTERAIELNWCFRIDTVEDIEDP